MVFSPAFRSTVNPVNDKAITSIVTVLLAIIGVAVIAVLVSKQSDTTNVLNKFGNAISQLLCTAVSPIMGGSCGNSLIPSVNSTITFPTG